MIEPALRSLIALDHPAFEIIVIDQSSDDITGELARGLAGVDSRIRYVHSRRVGLSCGRNDGIAESHGDVVAFTDDDCVVDPGWLSAIEAEMDDPEVAGVFGRVLPNEYRGRSGIDLAFKDSEERKEYRERLWAWCWRPVHQVRPMPRRLRLEAAGDLDLAARGAALRRRPAQVAEPQGDVPRLHATRVSMGRCVALISIRRRHRPDDLPSGDAPSERSPSQ